MRQCDRRIKRFLAAGVSGSGGGEGLQGALQKSRQALCESEEADVLSYREFLFLQSRYIRKCWWLLQGAVLAALWLLLELTESGYYMQRYMAVAASLFGVLVLPEVWKNRSANAVEVEGAAYYSLRQVYAARIFLFALVDFVLLCVFFLAALQSGASGMEEMLTQFLLPYVMTCCICFKTLYSRWIGAPGFALFLCIAWSLVWLMIVSEERIYSAVSFPAWLAMLAAAAVYLGHCIWRGQRDCDNLLEVKPLWS